MRGRCADTDALIDRLAARQHGLVTRAQLMEAGIGRHAIAARARAQRLRTVHRGVYRVGPVVASHSREMAAVLACGAGAVVSHASAAGLGGLDAPPPARVPVDVTIPPGTSHRRSGIRAHRSGSLAPDEIATVEGIPVTTPARTILDLSGVVRDRRLEQMLARAEREGLTDREDVASLLARYPGRAGTRALRALLRSVADPKLTRSPSEERLLELVIRGGLPTPETNVTIAGREVDLFWRAERVAVEVDGFTFHRSRGRFVGDRRKGLDLSARGVQVVRLTWDQIVHDRDRTLVRLAQTLATTSLG